MFGDGSAMPIGARDFDEFFATALSLIYAFYLIALSPLLAQKPP